MKRVRYVIALIIFGLALIGFPFFVEATSVYSNGYFRYTVDDHSVTIISYTGNETEVTVPNMIAGNPVNVIGKGAFVKNESVNVIHLPDTIMSVEEDAFGEGQKVIYDYENDDSGSDEKQEEEKKPEEGNKKPEEGSSDNPGRGDDNGKKDEGKKSEGKKADGGRSDDVKKPEKKDDNNKGNKSDEDVKEDKGKTEDTPYIDVDNDDNLILVDKNGNEKVLDDTRAYRKRTDTEGNEIIEDIAGNVVQVTDSGTVEYIDKDNNKVSVDTRTGNKTVTAPDGSFGYEEVNIPESEEADTPESEEVRTPVSEEVAGVDEPEDKKVAGGEEDGVDDSKEIEEVKADDFPLATIVVMVIALAAVVYIVLFRRKKE